MAWETAMYQWVQSVIALLWHPALAVIVGPAITLAILLRFLRWSHSAARGERLDEIRDDWRAVETDYWRLREGVRPRSAQVRTPTAPPWARGGGGRR